MLKGHYGYYGVIFNYRSMGRFRHLVGKLWFLALRRRSQRTKRTWEWFEQFLAVFPLPKPVIHQRWFGGEHDRGLPVVRSRFNANFIAVKQHEVGTGQRDRHGAAYALRTSGNDADPASQVK